MYKRQDDNYHKNIIENLREIPGKIDQILACDELIKGFAEEIKNQKSLFYIGRGIDYATAIEAALKLKEVSYIHTEAFAAGELKHGTISLIEDKTPVIAIMTQENLIGKSLSNVEEVVARGANVFIITSHKDTRMEKITENILVVPKTLDILYPLLTALPCQLMAYYTCLLYTSPSPRD